MNIRKRSCQLTRFIIDTTLPGHLLFTVCVRRIKNFPFLFQLRFTIERYNICTHIHICMYFYFTKEKRGLCIVLLNPWIYFDQQVVLCEDREILWEILRSCLYCAPSWPCSWCHLHIHRPSDRHCVANSTHLLHTCRLLGRNCTWPQRILNNLT